MFRFTFQPDTRHGHDDPQNVFGFLSEAFILGAVIVLLVLFVSALPLIR